MISGENCINKIIKNCREGDEMTLRQEAYKRIDQMSEAGIRFFLDMFDSLQTMSAGDFKRQGKNDIGNEAIEQLAEAAEVDIVDKLNLDAIESMTKEEKKNLFLQSAGRMRIDADAIRDLRERSMI
ncbi:MAG: hypothetical protein IJ733_04215 [Lachnospiraceae bacterium]|nr:hypothetical protein [Lachnospiraceae bacterium]